MSQREQQTQNLIYFAIAQGLTTERAEQLRATFKAERMSPEEAAQQIKVELEERKPQPIGGEVSFDQRLADMLGDVLAKAIEKAAEKVVK